ncbi:hypothetical protein BKA65DRAFT_548376 [Rhexocercosporidium sp. MPI-PUGE-AT-0058]|nr:hypothetical protein BKA65DRAFT_548376 [Rhexocercosporidium sp. MPI-PUGE-AT-0058]
MATSFDEYDSDKFYDMDGPLDLYLECALTSSCFGSLPAELRLRIWKAHMQEPRIISIEHGSLEQPHELGLYETITPQHTTFKVSAESRKLLVVFHTCHQSRVEALKLPEPILKSAVGYPGGCCNPKVDIFYIGFNACHETLADYLVNGPRVRRITVDIYLQLKTCWGVMDWQFPVPRADGVGIMQETSVLQLLHDFAPEKKIIKAHRSGCQTLKEVPVAGSVRTALTGFSPNPPISGGFAPLLNSKVVMDETCIHAHCRRQFLLVETGLGLGGAEKNVLVGGRMPTFLVVRICRQPLPNT